MKISEIIERLLSIPKSLYVSYRLFPIKDAIKLPVLVRYNCSLLSLQGLVRVVRGGEICNV